MIKSIKNSTSENIIALNIDMEKRIDYDMTKNKWSLLKLIILILLCISWIYVIIYNFGIESSKEKDFVFLIIICIFTFYSIYNIYFFLTFQILTLYTDKKTFDLFINRLESNYVIENKPSRKFRTFSLKGEPFIYDQYLIIKDRTRNNIVTINYKFRTDPFNDDLITGVQLVISPIFYNNNFLIEIKKHIFDIFSPTK